MDRERDQETRDGFQFHKKAETLCGQQNKRERLSTLTIHRMLDSLTHFHHIINRFMHLPLCHILYRINNSLL